MKHRYSPEVEQTMRDFYDSLAEHQRRRYAAIEATKFGHGGQVYLASVLGCDEKTIRRGISELSNPVDLPQGRSRKKGADDIP